MMRRHALRSFLEETCGTVSSAFDVLAGIALKASVGAGGSPQDRLNYAFRPEELSATLAALGYGAGASGDWCHALFSSLDVDADGAVSLQDVVDALVLELPASADEPSESPRAFFSDWRPDSARWRRGTVHRPFKTVLRSELDGSPVSAGRSVR